MFSSTQSIKFYQQHFKTLLSIIQISIFSKQKNLRTKIENEITGQDVLTISDWLTCPELKM